MGLALQVKRAFGISDGLADLNYQMRIHDAAFDYYVTHGHLHGFRLEDSAVEYPFKNNGENATPQERDAFMKRAQDDYGVVTRPEPYTVFRHVVYKGYIGSFLLNAASAGYDISPQGNIWEKFGTTHEDFLRACTSYLRHRVEYQLDFLLCWLDQNDHFSKSYAALEESLSDMSKVAGRPLELYQALGTTKETLDNRILAAVFGERNNLTPLLKSAMDKVSIHPQRVREFFNAQSDDAKITIEQRLAQSRQPSEKPVLPIKRRLVTDAGVRGAIQRMFGEGTTLRYA